MPTNKTLGKPATEVLLILAEKKVYLTYINIVDINFENKFDEKPTVKKKTESHWMNTYNRYRQAIKCIRKIEANTGYHYIKSSETGKLFKIHDGTCFDKRSCIILLEFYYLHLTENEVRKNNFEERIYEKYKSIENHNDWSVSFIIKKMTTAKKNFYVKLKDGKYEMLERLSHDLGLIKELGKSYRDKRADEDVKKKLTDLLDNI